MNHLLNVSYFANQFADRNGHGMSRYARELFDAIHEQSGLSVAPVSAWSSLPPKDLDTLQKHTGLHLLKSGRRGTSYGWTFAGMPRIEWMLPETDVVHSVCMGYPVGTKKPLVVTVHDIGPLTHPEFFSHNRPWVMRRALDQAVKKADKLVCISHATAEEVRSIYGPVSNDQIEVVHSGVSDRFFENPGSSALDGLDLPPADVPFIMTAGAMSPRKNLVGVLRALREAKSQIPHHIVLVGGSGWDMEQIFKEIDSPDLAARVHLLGYVSDEAVRALYRRAAFYVHPTLYEGFGLTVLEAMASGTPVITSNLSSLPEIAGDAALQVDPNDPKAISDAIIRLSHDPELAQSLRDKGLQRARSFSWSKTANTMRRIYREIAR